MFKFNDFVKEYMKGFLIYFKIIPLSRKECFYVIHEITAN